MAGREGLLLGLCSLPGGAREGATTEIATRGPSISSPLRNPESEGAAEEHMARHFGNNGWGKAKGEPLPSLVWLSG